MKDMKQSMSKDTWDELFTYYSQIPNTNFHPHYVEKRMGLMMLGLKEDEVEKMCRRKDNRKQIMKAVKAEQERELRKLARLSRERNDLKHHEP